MSKIKGLAGSISSESSFPGLEMNALSVHGLSSELVWEEGERVRGRNGWWWWWWWCGAGKLCGVSSCKDSNPIGSGPYPYDLIEP